MIRTEIPAELLSAFRDGMVIPALPLALDAKLKLDPRRQRALVRYYLAAGAGGLAVGVHSTQFEIHDPAVGLYEPVLSLAAEEVARRGKAALMIAGLCGQTPQALAEAKLARRLGYHAGLLSLKALGDAPDKKLLAHCRAVAEVMPIVGFYLQTSVGGRVLGYDFWRQFAAIENVLGVKMAPFDRYKTLDVVRGVCDAGKAGEVVLYTGNDDNIVLDLLTEFEVSGPAGLQRVGIVGGLLGHWGVWTSRAVPLLQRIKTERRRGQVSAELLTLSAQVTDANAAVFDAANGFKGCIAGILEVLRRQGLLEAVRCLNPAEKLSPGQSAELDRVYAGYPHLTDDAFVAAHLDEWLAS
ncbi:MAG TPA: dihydrodipicolinate synthase family protein [Phycisphaerales bacterium]|nr:dihydrodipicolinate synthase family protein [Phycisphaerales bacterium]